MFLVKFEYNKRGKPGDGILIKTKLLRKTNTIEEAKKFAARFRNISETKYHNWCFRIENLDKEENKE